MISLIKNSRLRILIFILGVGLFQASCKTGCEEDCAEFSNFKLCGTAPVSEGCASNLNVISPDDTHITVSVEIKHGKPNDRLTVTLFQESGSSFTEFFTQSIPLKDIDPEVNGDERKIRGSIGVPKRVDRQWPVGNYKVELELSQENIPLNETRNFSVQ